MRLQRIAFILTALLTSLCCAYGQERIYDDLFELSMEELFDTKVQVVTKSLISNRDAPVPSIVITRKEIERTSARSIGELLRNVPGVNVRWNPMMQTIDIRGFGQNPFTSRVLLLIDGIPYNSWNKGGFPQHPGVQFFPLDDVKQIEIIKSPGSSLYGENAYWGVINIVSMSGKDQLGGNARLYAGNFDTYGGSVRLGSELSEDLNVYSSFKWSKKKYL